MQFMNWMVKMDGELSSLITLGVAVAVLVEAVGVPLQVLI